jgi:hypothetical protein
LQIPFLHKMIFSCVSGKNSVILSAIISNYHSSKWDSFALKSLNCFRLIFFVSSVLLRSIGSRTYFPGIALYLIVKRLSFTNTNIDSETFISYCSNDDADDYMFFFFYQFFNKFEFSHSLHLFLG